VDRAKGIGDCHELDEGKEIVGGAHEVDYG